MKRFIISCVVMCALSGSQLLDPTGWAMASDKPIANTPQPSSAVSEKADKELATLRQNPEEFRTLVTGVQIFLGRFGYGLGPFTGQLDQATKDALKAYQKKTGLAETGDINFHTLRRLTEDDTVLSRIVPFLPAQVTRIEEWDKWVELQGSWMLKEGNTDDVLHTSRISCMHEFQRCIESTASLVNASVPQLKVHTHVYDIKEWDDNKIVSFPYDGEECALRPSYLKEANRNYSVRDAPGQTGNVCEGQSRRSAVLIERWSRNLSESEDAKSERHPTNLAGGPIAGAVQQEDIGVCDP